MTPTQYRESLAAAGLTQVGAAKVFGVDGRQSRRWAAGDAPIPHSVVLLLALLGSGKITVADLLAIVPASQTTDPIYPA